MKPLFVLDLVLNLNFTSSSHRHSNTSLVITFDDFGPFDTNAFVICSQGTLCSALEAAQGDPPIDFTDL